VTIEIPQAAQSILVMDVWIILAVLAGGFVDVLTNAREDIGHGQTVVLGVGVDRLLQHATYEIDKHRVNSSVDDHDGQVRGPVNLGRTTGNPGAR
jgi:hypothetical protein